MQRTRTQIQIKEVAAFKTQLLYWAQQFDTAVWLDSNEHTEQYGQFDALLAVDELSAIKTGASQAFDTLKHYQSKTKDYLFGYMSYDLKNDIEPLQSANFDALEFPELYFFQPKKIFVIRGHELTVEYALAYAHEIPVDLAAIEALTTMQEPKGAPLDIHFRMDRSVYLNKVNTLLKHLQRGDLYEANFCQEFYSSGTTINPVATFQQLNHLSRTPFASFLKLQERYLLCASPERYLKKEGATVISQPIKGTERRSNNAETDALLARHLAKNPKECAENIMIVDLVRNDLSRIAESGSVKVEELCGVYTFEQVHQLISTVSCKVCPETHPVDIIRNTFPMGSMTGAPKISAMKIIETQELTKRGLYSGAVGYFTPKGDFDFNVVIRSLLYNAAKQYISFSVGGAITAQSIPEKEYEECLLKAQAIKTVLLDRN